MPFRSWDNNRAWNPAWWTSVVNLRLHKRSGISHNSGFKGMESASVIICDIDHVSSEGQRRCCTWDVPCPKLPRNDCSREKSKKRSLKRCFGKSTMNGQHDPARCP